MLDHIRIEKIISASILPPNFFLDVLVVLPVRQLQSWAILGKNDVKPWEKGKNPTLILNPIWGPPNFFQEFYQDNIPSYHTIQFLEKLMNYPWKRNEKPNFGPDFGLFGPNLEFQLYFWV